MRDYLTAKADKRVLGLMRGTEQNHMKQAVNNFFWRLGGFWFIVWFRVEHIYDEFGEPTFKDTIKPRLKLFN